jgi:hypothetical protein
MSLDGVGENGQRVVAALLAPSAPPRNRGSCLNWQKAHGPWHDAGSKIIDSTGIFP